MSADVDPPVRPDIATVLAAMGGVLRCAVCGHKQALGDADLVHGYIRDGWPQHCGRTMRWLSQQQLDKQQRRQERRKRRRRRA